MANHTWNMDYQSGIIKIALIFWNYKKKIIRNICNSKYNSHTDPLFGKTKLLKKNDLFKTSSIRNIRKAHLGQTPTIIQEIYGKHTSERPLRTPNNIKPIHSSGRIHYELPMIWNGIDEVLKDNISVKNLTNKIKTLCIDQYNEFKCENIHCYSCSTNSN